MAERIPQSTAKRVTFRAYLTSDHVTPATGKTIAITISKNGGAFANPAAGATNATEIASGFYYFDLGTGDAGTLGPLAWRGAEGTIDDAGDVYEVVDTYQPVNVVQISGDATAADNVEAAFDGTGGVGLTLSTITLSGAMTIGGNLAVTGALDIDDGIIVTVSTTDRAALSLAGNGAGAGAKIQAGTTGIGLDVDGGTTSGVGMAVNSTSGDAVQFTAGGGNGDGLQLTGNGTGKGLRATGGVIGDGIYGASGGSSNYGIRGAGGTVGIGGTGGSIAGILGQGGIGLYAEGTTSVGALIAGAATSVGLQVNGGLTSGAAVALSTTTGDVVTVTSGGGNGNAFSLVPHGTGYGISGTLSAVGAAGAALSAIPWNASWDAEVQSEVDDAMVAYSAAKVSDVPTAAANADAVWDEAISGHLTAGTTGAALNAAGAAGDPWGTTLPGAYSAGTAGYIIGNNLDVASSTLATAASISGLNDLDAAGVRAAVGLATANLDTQLATIAGYIDTEVAAILSAIAALNDLDAAGVRAAVGLATANLDTQLATIDTVVDAIVADTGTDGVILSVTYLNKIADHILRRSLATAAASSDGDTVGFRSLLGASRKLVNKVAFSGSNLVIYEEDDATSAGSQAASTDAAAEPVVGLDTV